jgi:type VI secretion system protein ImpH
MATKDRGNPAVINNAVLHEGRRFSFIQAIRLLRLLVCQEEKKRPDDSIVREAIRVRPSLSLDFPGTDIVSIEENPDNSHFRFLITATFLGLYGASSPLPTFYTEDLMDEAAEDMSVARDFMDIINSPLYPLRFQCWSKYRLGIKIVEEEDPQWLERLFCLLGLGVEEIRQDVDDAYGLVRYIGLFTQMPRSAQGLETLLSDALNVPQLKILPCIPKKTFIPEDQLCLLGISGNRLGMDSYVGQTVKDRMGKFRIRIGPVNGRTFHDWLPDTGRFQRLGTLIKVYLDQPLEWDLEMLLGDGEARTTRLGGSNWSRLGWNTWLFSAETGLSKVRARFRKRTGFED